MGQYDPGLVATERDGLLDDPSYVEGLPPDHSVRDNQNVFAFGLSAASLEVLQLLSMVVTSGEVADTGGQNSHFVTGNLDLDYRGCRPSYPYSGGLQAMGDRSGVSVVGRQHLAERERATRASVASRPRIQVARLMDDLVARVA